MSTRPDHRIHEVPRTMWELVERRAALTPDVVFVNDEQGRTIYANRAATRLLGKASPQMPLIFLGPAIKGLFGLLLMAAAMHYWPDLFSRLFTNSLGLTERVLHLAR